MEFTDSSTMRLASGTERDKLLNLARAVRGTDSYEARELAKMILDAWDGYGQPAPAAVAAPAKTWLEDVREIMTAADALDQITGVSISIILDGRQ